MKIVFEYIKDFHDTYSSTRKSKYYVYDLTFKSDRYHLHQMINDYVYDELTDGTLVEEDEQEVYDEEEKVHELISNQDGEGLENGSFEYFFFEVIEHTLVEALKEAGYEVERSNASASLYVNLNGKEIRISDHKRPAYDSGNGIYLDHEYDAEIITDDNRVTKKQLEKVGINLNEEVYYLE